MTNRSQQTSALEIVGTIVSLAMIGATLWAVSIIVPVGGF